MKDRTGRDLKPGQAVDISLLDVQPSGILSAFVVDVKEGGLVDARGRPEPARLILQIGVPLNLNPGQEAPVYITHQPEELEEAHAQKPSKGVH